MLGLTWGQIWCLPMFIIGGYMLYKILSPNYGFKKNTGRVSDERGNTTQGDSFKSSD